MPKASATPAISGEPVGQSGDAGIENNEVVYPSGAESEAMQMRAVAQYLADMVGQLESMARAAKLDLLVYLLSMAREEAETHTRLDFPPEVKRR